MRYLLRRGVQTIWLVLSVSLLTFVMLELAPGDFLTELRADPRIAPATVDALRQRYGLDDGLLVRYVHWLSALSRGDLGYSLAYEMPAASLLWGRALNTLALTVPATLAAWLLAMAIGIAAASARGGWVDRAAGGATSLAIAVPDLLVPLLLVALVARTGWLPSGGMASLDAAGAGGAVRFLDLLRHAVLPLCALVVAIFPTVFRHVRSAMLSALDAPPIRAARGHGIGRRTLVLRHAVPLAANPLISLFGLSLATLLSASLLTEIIMGWPGLGPLFLDAILARDIYLVVGAVVLSTAFLAAASLIVDVLLVVTDPRIRLT
jgi:peptide/nickel transport system permease protein